MIRTLFSAGAAAFVLAAAAPAAAQPEPSVSHMEAATELVDMMNMAESLQAGIELMLQAQVSANAELVRYEDVLREFMRTYLSWERLRPDFAALYAEMYTEAELREMARFFSTPVGRKMIEQEPELMERAGVLGEQHVLANITEFYRMLEQADGKAGGGKP